MHLLIKEIFFKCLEYARFQTVCILVLMGPSLTVQQKKKEEDAKWKPLTHTALLFFMVKTRSTVLYTLCGTGELLGGKSHNNYEGPSFSHVIWKE